MVMLNVNAQVGFMFKTDREGASARQWFKMLNHNLADAYAGKAQQTVNQLVSI
jgi:hypothetical protein